MKINILSKATPSQLPPLMAIALYCKDLGYDVNVITQNVGKEKDLFDKRGVTVESIVNDRLPIPFIGKLFHWYRFRRYINKKLRSIDEHSIVWITGADTLVLTNISLLKGKKSIFQLNELNDDLPCFRKLYEKKLKYFDRIVVPETNRSYIAQVLYKLSRLPFVLPNKPYDINDTALAPDDDVLKIINKIENEKVKGKVVFIYQGYVSELRDLTQLCIYVERHREKCSLVLMGANEGALKKYKNICKDLIYVPFITAPWHLYVTSKCDVGIMIYLPVSLNNIYCAPNKIWEYSKFGLAMVGNDIPGLAFLDSSATGCTIRLDDSINVETKLNLMIENIEAIKNNSRHFYESLDMKKVIGNILDF